MEHKLPYKGMPGLKQRVKKATSTRKGKIIFFSILFSVLSVLVTGLVYWQVKKKKLIRDTLESSVRKKSNGLYKISYDKLELDEVSGFLSIKNMRLEYDSIKYAVMVENNTAPPSLFRISIPEISVFGVETPRALISKEIAGRKIEIKNPSIEIIFTSEGKDSARYTPTKEVYKQILGNLEQISFDTVHIAGAVIRTSDLRTKKQDIGLYNTFIELTNVKIDSAANADTTRMVFSKNINLRCDSLFWNTPDQLYKIGGDTLALSSAGKNISVKRFYIEPQMPEDVFLHSVPTQTDRLNFSIRNIDIKNIDFLNLFDENIVADSLTIGSASFKLYRDLSIPRDHKNRVGTYPQQVIAKIPVPIEIKKLTAKNTFVEYKEKSDKTGRAGKVQFYNANAVFSNVTNKKTAISINNKMSAHINSRLLNKASFETDWTFYLGNPNGRFDVKGHLSGMDARDLNPMLVPMGPARIEEGKINSLYFNFTGSDYKMNGDVKFLYENLKISLLEKDDDTKKLEKKGVASFISNIIIKKSNPSGKDKPRTVNIENDRDANRSIFHFAWHTLLAGIKSTLGMGSKSK